MQERDDAARRVVLAAKGMGAANESVTSWLAPGEDATTVKMKADIHLTGTIAQLRLCPPVPFRRQQTPTTSALGHSYPIA